MVGVCFEQKFHLWLSLLADPKSVCRELSLLQGRTFAPTVTLGNTLEYKNKRLCYLLSARSHFVSGKEKKDRRQHKRNKRLTGRLFEQNCFMHQLMLQWTSHSFFFYIDYCFYWLQYLLLTPYSHYHHEVVKFLPVKTSDSSPFAFFRGCSHSAH